MRFLNASFLERKALNRNLSWGFPLGNLLPETRVLKRCVLERKRRRNANASVLETQRFRTLRASAKGCSARIALTHSFETQRPRFWSDQSCPEQGWSVGGTNKVGRREKTPTPEIRFSIWTLLRTPGRFTTRPLPVHFTTKMSVVRSFSVLSKDEIGP